MAMSTSFTLNGQQVQVAGDLAMLVAEELEVGLDQVDMLMGDTDLCPWDPATGGSLNLWQFLARCCGGPRRRPGRCCWRWPRSA